MATQINTAVKCVGYEQITGLSSVKTLTVPALNGIKAKRAIIQAETQNVRARTDGTDPTSSVGFIITTTQPLDITCDLEAFEFIEAAASAKLNVLYFI